MSKKLHTIKEEWQCKRKIHRFATEIDAEEHALQFWHETGGALSVYHCPYCGFYHLGHTPKKRIRPHRRKREAERAQSSTLSSGDDAGRQ